MSGEWRGGRTRSPGAARASRGAAATRRAGRSRSVAANLRVSARPKHGQARRDLDDYAAAAKAGAPAAVWLAWADGGSWVHHMAAIGYGAGIRAACGLGLAGRADVRAPTPRAEARTPLHYAAFAGRAGVVTGPGGDRRVCDLDCVSALLDCGADVEARDGRGHTALHVAAAGGHADAARALLARGARVDARTAGGDSALSLAAARGLGEAVDALLAAGADPTAVDGRGRSVAGAVQFQLGVVDRQLSDMVAEDLRRTAGGFRGVVRVHAEGEYGALCRLRERLEGCLARVEAAAAAWRARGAAGGAGGEGGRGAGAGPRGGEGGPGAGAPPCGEEPAQRTRPSL